MKPLAKDVAQLERDLSLRYAIALPATPKRSAAASRRGEQPSVLSPSVRRASSIERRASESSAFTLIELLACHPKPQMDSERRKAQSAFTLIELLVVIGIMGLMIGLAVPAFNSATRGNAVTTGASQLVNTLMLTRAKAITSRTHVRIIFADTSTNSTAFTTSAYGKTAYAVLMCTNLNFVQAGESLSTVPCWIYLDRWQQLPKGAYIPSDLLQLEMLKGTPTTTTQYMPFPTNGTAYPSAAMPYIEFKSTGATTSGSDLYIPVREGTLLPSGTIGNIRTANTLSNQIFSITGVAKVLR